MKKLLLTILLVSSVNAIAETYSRTDTINRIGALLIREESDFIILNGFVSAGTCPLSDGLVVARFPYGESGNRAYSLALAAKMSGKKIRLAVDDANKHPVDGSCFVKSVQISD